MPNYATDGQLPRDTVGFPSEGLYVPNSGTVASRGWLLQTDGTNQPSGAQGTYVEGTVAANSDNNVLIASAALTTNTNSADQTNNYYRGIVVFVNPGSFGSGATAITVTIQGKDPVSGSYYTILTSASLSASTFATLTVYPGNAVSANVSASTVLPKTWRVAAAASAWGTGGSTLGVSYAYIL